MAFSISMQSLLLPSKAHSSAPSTFPLYFLENNFKNESYNNKFRSGKGKFCRKCRAMVQQTVQGPSAAYAKEMERLSAKESLLLAFRDAGGFEALVTGKTTDMQRIDVNERIVGLERLNPTPRPTTSPYLEGKWNFEWFGSGSMGFLAAQFLLERFPPELANLSKLDVVIKDTYANIAATKRVFGQAASTLQQLPVPIRDAVAGGLTIPLGGSLERYFMISYLDDEIVIIRDTAGVPEVLTRLDPGPSPVAEPITEYES